MCLMRKRSFLSSGPSDRLTVGHYFSIHTESFHFWNNILNGFSQQRSIFSPRCNCSGFRRQKQRERLHRRLSGVLDIYSLVANEGKRHKMPFDELTNRTKRPSPLCDVMKTASVNSASFTSMCHGVLQSRLYH